MSDPVNVGYIAKDGRILYLVMEEDGEVFKVHEADFRIFLTQRAIQGCKISEIEKLMEKHD